MSEQLNTDSEDIVTMIDLREDANLDRDFREVSAAVYNTWWYTYAIQVSNLSKLSEIQDRFMIIYCEGLNVIVKDTYADKSIRSESELEQLRISPWFDSVVPRVPNKEPAVLCYADDSWSGNRLYINNNHKRMLVIDALTILESISSSIHIFLLGVDTRMFEYIK